MFVPVSTSRCWKLYAAAFVSLLVGGIFCEHRRLHVEGFNADELESLRSLVSKAYSVLRDQQKDEEQENQDTLRLALHYFQNAIDIFEGNPVDEGFQEESPRMYANAAAVSFRISETADGLAKEDASALEWLWDAIELAEIYLPDMRVYIYEQLQEVLTVIQQRNKCLAAEYYNRIWLDQGEDLAQIRPSSLLLDLVRTIGTCYPDQGVVLWADLMKLGYLTVENATSCHSCWLSIAIANARHSSHSTLTDGIQAVEDLFLNKWKLPHYTPYQHAAQLPRIFNAALSTVEPEPFKDPPNQYQTCQALEEHKDAILMEYGNYQALVRQNETSILHEASHPDSSLAEGSGGGWDGLFLRRYKEDQWEEVCNHYFPQTCAALHGIAGVNTRLTPGTAGDKHCSRHDNAGYPEWCGGFENQLPGVVAFWSLQPGAQVRLHAGPTNERLKCHLVIDAPSNGTAWMQVGRIRRTQATGDVIAFDDSYLHAVGNDDATQVRVILDVTFFHPDLLKEQTEVQNDEL